MADGDLRPRRVLVDTDAWLTARSLPDMYQAAWEEAAEDRSAWDATLKDGLADETW
jgi:hypothetical protein